MSINQPPTGAPPPPPPPSAPPIVAMPTGAVGPDLRLVESGRRFLAFLVDLGLIIVTLFIGWLIWDIVLWGRGQSPGKMIMKMRVHRVEDGRAASWSEMVLRELVGKWVLSIVPFWTIINGVFILVDHDKHQAIWDKIGKTVVVDERPSM